MSINSKQSNSQDFQVKLPVLSGIPPARYLPVIALVICLLLFFIFLLLPGMIKRGIWLEIDSLPPKAQVRIDGLLIGTTPINFFLKNGEHEIKLTHNFFEDKSLMKNVRGRLAGTLFFPDKEALVVTFNKIQIEPSLSFQLHEIARYGMSANYSAPETFPPLYQDLIAILQANEPGMEDRLDRILDDGLAFTDSEPELRALLSARAQLASDGKVFSQQAMLELLLKFITLKEKYPGFPYWLKHASDKPGDRKPLHILWSSTWFQSFEKQYKEQWNPEKFLDPEYTTFSGETVFSKGITFIPVPGNDMKTGNVETMNPLPHLVSISPFFVASTEITNGQFYKFVSARPAWAKRNSTALLADGKINSDYLAHWQGEKPSRDLEQFPVIHISWYAAHEFTLWLNDNFRKTGAPYSARLPEEDEFEYLMQITGEFAKDEEVHSGMDSCAVSPESIKRIVNIKGNVNEWCEEWYYPCADTLFEVDSTDNQRLIPGTEKVVRGGAWINQLDRIDSSTRGAQPPSWCSPYTGFRVVLIKEGIENGKR